MNKLFNFAQAKGKWHKFPSFNLGGGAKLYKNFAQKLLAVSLCMAVVLLGTPVTTFADKISTQLDVAVFTNGVLTTLECTLTDKDDTPLGGKEVKVNVPGFNWMIATTDESGKVQSFIPLMDPGSYTVEVKFAGDTLYAGTTGSKTFKFFPITLKDDKGTEIDAGLKCSKVVKVGDKLKFSADVDSGDAENTGVTWSVNDKSIATIDAATGELTVNNFGTVWVTATFRDNPSVYAKLRLDLRESLDVNDLRILDWTGKDVTGLSATLAVSRGVTAALTPGFRPDFAEDDSSTVTFAGTNISVATVFSNGSLTVHDYGKVRVTATSLDDQRKSVTVKVSPPSTAVTGRGAPHSVALLTLTATGDEDDYLKADMTWKTFIPGTTVDLELKFVMPDGSVAGQVNLMDWVATYGDMAHTDPGFVPLVPPRWGALFVGTIPLAVGGDSGGGYGGLGFFTLGWDGSVTLPPGFALVAALSGFVPPLCSPLFASVPGLARLAPGGAVAFDYKTWFASDITDPVWSVSSSDPSVAVWEDGYIKGLSEGTATLTFMADGKVSGTVEVAVGDWVPPHEVPAGLSAVAGTRLGDVALPAPTGAGEWEWVHPDDLLTTPGTTTHKALYTPTDTDSNSYCPVLVDVPVEVYLEKTVTVKGKTQRLRVYNPNNVLPDGTIFEALAVPDHKNLDPTHAVEHLWSYDLSLMDAQANPLHMPLDAPVELCFEVLDGLDRDELEVVLVKEFDDAEFEETLANLDGASWVKVKTDHFSPYALIDKLSPEEKGVQVQDDPGPADSSYDSSSGAGNNVKTGDLATQMTVAGLGMTLVLALGIMLRLITSKRRFEA